MLAILLLSGARGCGTSATCLCTRQRTRRSGAGAWRGRTTGRGARSYPVILHTIAWYKREENHWPRCAPCHCYDENALSRRGGRGGETQKPGAAGAGGQGAAACDCPAALTLLLLMMMTCTWIEVVLDLCCSTWPCPDPSGARWQPPRRWLLLLAVVQGAGASLVPPASALARSVLARLGLSVGAGTLVGAFLALELVPRQASLQVGGEGGERRGGGRHALAQRATAAVGGTRAPPEHARRFQHAPPAVAHAQPWP